MVESQYADRCVRESFIELKEQSCLPEDCEDFAVDSVGRCFRLTLRLPIFTNNT